MAELVEVLGGYRLGDNGNLEALAPRARSERLAELRDRVWPASEDETDCVAYLRWHLEHPHERTISPFSKITVDDYLWQLPDAKREDRRWQGVGFHSHPLLAEILPLFDETSEP